ncbi:MAG: PDZ domain-containing protein [Verrucomicrobiota bacterium]
MSADIDPRVEWRQLFRDTWRIVRDFFYDPNMHGVDWAGVYAQYAELLDECASREDVQYLIGEMIAELNVGHAYLRSAGMDADSASGTSVGLLGCDYVIEDDAYKIARIFSGAAWDSDARGPLGRPGMDVQEGDYLLAVNGVQVRTDRDPYSYFVGLAGRETTLTVSKHPKLDDDARTVVVVPVSSEGGLRYRHWIEESRRYVDLKSDGRVGYIYVPNTGRDGQNDLVRQLVGQLHKDALIIDERWNGGGQIPTRFIELLNRPVTNYWAVRDGRDWVWPPDAHHGPKCMLINGPAGSGGDAFPYYFRQAGLGTIIGTRTWGGLVGISGNPGLIDGGGVTVPTFAFYEADGTWGIEGYGVDPDIEVPADPTRLAAGTDPQLDAAVEHLAGCACRDPNTPSSAPRLSESLGNGNPRGGPLAGGRTKESTVACRSRPSGSGEPQRAQSSQRDSPICHGRGSLRFSRIASEIGKDRLCNLCVLGVLCGRFFGNACADQLPQRAQSSQRDSPICHGRGILSEAPHVFILSVVLLVENGCVDCVSDFRSAAFAGQVDPLVSTELRSTTHRDPPQHFLIFLAATAGTRLISSNLFGY